MSSLQVTKVITSLNLEANTRRERPLSDSTGIRYLDNIDVPMDYYTQVEVLHRCQGQAWGSVFCQADFETKGRGLVALQRIRQNDIVVDYHGKVIYVQH